MTTEGGVKIEKDKALLGLLNESEQKYGSVTCNMEPGDQETSVFPVLLSGVPEFCQNPDAE